MAVDGAGAAPPPDRADDSAVEDIVAAFLLEREDGRNPSVDDYLARYPRHAEALAKLLSDDTASPATMRRTTARGTPSKPAPSASDSPPQQPPSAASRLGPYEILSHVSTAGGGTVYRARHAEAGHVVALKVLDARGAVDPRDLERFRREAAMLRALNLVNVVPVLDSGDDGGRFWIAMKWLEGSTLGSLREAAREKSHPLRDQRERARLVSRIARTFAAIHGAGILHRDVKPTNIMVDQTGEPMIIDFGIAQAPDLPELTATTDQVMGTPRYLAPELLAGGNRQVSPRTDVYGLGLCLYELCTGVLAFQHEQRADLFTAIRTIGPLPPRRANPAIPHDLAAVILRALEIDPARRYPDMTAFADDLDRVARGEAPDLATLRGAHPLLRTLRRHRRRILAAACLAAVLLPAGWVLTRRTLDGVDAREREAALRPFVFVPPESFAGSGLLPKSAAAALARNPAASVDQRLVAAWIPFLSGGVREALANLGASDQPGEGFAARFFRDHLVDLRNAQTEGDQPARFVDPRTKRVLVNPQTGEEYEAMVPSDNPEGVLVRDPERFEESLERIVRATPPRTPADHLLRAVLAWSQVPNDPRLDTAERRAAIERDVDVALRDAETRGAAAHLKGLLRFVARDPKGARAFLEEAFTSQREATGTRILLGVACLQAGDASAAVAHLSGAIEALPRGHPARFRTLGHLALAHAGAGDVPRAVEACAMWWTEGEAGLAWQDAVIPRVLLARIRRDRGELGEARALLLTAIHEEERIKQIIQEANDRGSRDVPELLVLWRPALDALLSVLRAMDDTEMIEDLAAKMTSFKPLDWPPSVEAYLEMNLVGLRAPDPVRVMTPVSYAAETR